MNMPYHLRTNKYIDRSLFISLLRRLELPNLHGYTYIGFGGPFMDDFRVLHHALAFDRMISIEERENTYHRQALNVPCSNVELQLTTLSSFLESHQFDDPTIIWTDYESNHYDEQLTEAQKIILQLEEGDVVRITFKCKDFLPPVQQKQVNNSLLNRREALLRKLGPFRPEGEIPLYEFGRRFDLSSHLIQAFRRCAYRARIGRREKLVPLLTTIYRDTTPMLTVSGIITSDPLAYTKKVSTWGIAEKVGSLVRISSPTLSTAERIQVNRLLPCTTDELMQKATFTQVLQPQEVEGLVMFYRHLPHFHRSNLLV